MQHWAVAFLGATRAGNCQETDVEEGESQLSFATTYSGAATWKTSNATGSNPIQRDLICTGWTTCGNDCDLLDSIDATVDPAGQVLVGRRQRLHGRVRHHHLPDQDDDGLPGVIRTGQCAAMHGPDRGRAAHRLASRRAAPDRSGGHPGRTA